MTRFNCRLLQTCVKRTILRGVRAIAFFVLAVAGIHSRAEPITLRFQATIGPPNVVNPVDVPFDMPISFAEGDVIQGQFTINPPSVPASMTSTNGIQFQSAMFQVNSQTLHTTVYGLNIANDEFAFDGPEFPYDEIRLSCGPLTGNNPTCNPNTIAGAHDILWGFHLGLQGNASIFNEGEVVADPSTWNALSSWRFLSMSFRESDGPGIRRLTATVGEFVIVPEPASATHLLVLSILAVRLWPPRLREKYRSRFPEPCEGLSSVGFV